MSLATRIKVTGLYSALAAAPALSGGCGIRSTRDLPPNAGDIDFAASGPGARQSEDLWAALVAELGLKYQTPAATLKTEAELETELGTLPTRISDSNLFTTADIVTRGYTGEKETETPGLYRQPNAATRLTSSQSPFRATRCARVEALDALPNVEPYEATSALPLRGVRAFRLQYVLEDKTAAPPPSPPSAGLQDGAGSLGDKIVRSALLLVPAAQMLAGSKVPLALYGHAGDKGLGYSEIAELFGDLQTRLVIAAPSFPEEPICADSVSPLTGSCRGGDSETSLISEPTPRGTLRPFDTDADELLGLQHCLARAVFSANPRQDVRQFGFAQDDDPNSAAQSLTDLLAPVLQQNSKKPEVLSSAATTTSEALLAAEPRSLLVGASRGATASLIALAKSGAAQGSEELVGLSTSLSHFHCAALLFPATSFAVGRLRIGLELFIKGQARSSAFYSLPLAPALSAFFDDYRKGNASAAEMAERYMLIDPLFGAPLVARALRDWSEPPSQKAATSRGRMLLLHGRLDRLVGAENTRFYAAHLGHVSGLLAAAQQAPGVKIAALSFAPPKGEPFPPGTGITSLIYQHGDSVFRKSLSVPDTSEGPALSLFRRTLTSQAWNIAAASRSPESYDKVLMDSAELTPPAALRSWLRSSCPLSP